MKTPVYKPWVGPNFGYQPKRILILGESHYQWDADRPIDDWSTLTIECIQDQLKGERKAFWTNIVVTFIGHIPSLEEKWSFWNTVAFYNYIQANVGYGPKIRPTTAMWTEAERPFVQVLEDLSPNFVLCLGTTLWNCLPELNGSRDSDIEGSMQPETWRYRLGSDSTLAYAIRHPASFGFSAYYWHPFVAEAFHRA